MVLIKNWLSNFSSSRIYVQQEIVDILETIWSLLVKMYFMYDRTALLCNIYIHQLLPNKCVTGHI